jgi:hypothetical protein
MPADGPVTLAAIGEPGSPVRLVKGEFTGAYVAVRGDSAWLLVIGTRGEIAVTWEEEWRPEPKREWKESLWWPAARAR